MGDTLVKGQEKANSEIMTQKAVENLGEILAVVTEEVKNPYHLRPLVATDMGAICKIITKVGVRQFKECFKVEDFKGKNVEAVGFGVVFDIAGIVISNIPRAEDEIQAFLASLTGMSVEEVKKLPLADYGEMIMEVVMKEDFRDFFGRVMKLFNQ